MTAQMVEKGLIEGLANAGVPVLFAGLLLLGLVLLIRSSPGAAMARVRS